MVVVSVALCLFFTCFFQIFSLKWRDYLQDFCVFSVLACVFGVQYLQFVPISSQIIGLEFFLYLTLQTAMFTLYACLFQGVVFFFFVSFCFLLFTKSQSQLSCIIFFVCLVTLLFHLYFYMEQLVCQASVSCTLLWGLQK